MPWAEVQAALIQLREHPRFRVDIASVWDFRELMGTRFDGPEIREAIDVFTSLRSQGPTAVIVAEDLDFGLARQAQAYGENASLHMKVFREPDEALAWLLESKRSAE